MRYYNPTVTQAQSTYVPIELPWDAIAKAGAQKQGMQDKLTAELAGAAPDVATLSGDKEDYLKKKAEIDAKVKSIYDIGDLASNKGQVIKAINDIRKEYSPQGTLGSMAANKKSYDDYFEQQVKQAREDHKTWGEDKIRNYVYQQENDFRTINKDRPDKFNQFQGKGVAGYENTLDWALKVLPTVAAETGITGLSKYKTLNEFTDAWANGEIEHKDRNKIIDAFAKAARGDERLMASLNQEDIFAGTTGRQNFIKGYDKNGHIVLNEETPFGLQLAGIAGGAAYRKEKQDYIQVDDKAGLEKFKKELDEKPEKEFNTGYMPLVLNPNTTTSNGEFKIGANVINTALGLGKNDLDLEITNDDFGSNGYLGEIGWKTPSGKILSPSTPVGDIPNGSTLEGSEQFGARLWDVFKGKDYKPGDKAVRDAITSYQKKRDYINGVKKKYGNMSMTDLEAIQVQTNTMNEAANYGIYQSGSDDQKTADSKRLFGDGSDKNNGEVANRTVLVYNEDTHTYEKDDDLKNNREAGAITGFTYTGTEPFMYTGTIKAKTSVSDRFMKGSQDKKVLISGEGDEINKIANVPHLLYQSIRDGRDGVIVTDADKDFSYSIKHTRGNGKFDSNITKVALKPMVIVTSVEGEKIIKRQDQLLSTDMVMGKIPVNTAIPTTYADIVTETNYKISHSPFYNSNKH